jgi:hypothetical protein
MSGVLWGIKAVIISILFILLVQHIFDIVYSKYLPSMKDSHNNNNSNLNRHLNMATNNYESNPNDIYDDQDQDQDQDQHQDQHQDHKQIQDMQSFSRSDMKQILTQHLISNKA